MMIGEKIRVLIVDDIAETRENIRKLLQFESDIEVIGAARTGAEAIQLATELKPHVILMDINMPDMDGIAATEAIRQRFSWVQIVILSVQGDPNYMRRAMLAGARDFLTKPPAIDDLVSAIRRAGVMAVEEKGKAGAPAAPGKQDNLRPGTSAIGYQHEGTVITVYSPKGGVGCSTIAANLAITLQNDETQVVIVDGNLQFGDVAILFNEQGKNHVGDLTPRVDELDPDVVEEVLITHAESKVKILAAPPRPELAEEIHPSQFSRLLTYLRGLYPYIIVDTPSELNDLVVETMGVSDLIILVSTQDIPAIAKARLFLDLSRALGISNDKLIFIMNRYDKRINITPERVSENFKRPVEAIVPLDSRTVIPAINKGVPFMIDSKMRSQPASRAILGLAEIIRAKISV
jgi:pilus assembly protein CpaE